MTQTGFIAAMAAELAFAAYDSPAAVERAVSEWVIVSIWGSNREFLTLSRTRVPVRADDAPPELQPCCTYLGVLLSRVGVPSEEASEYLLMRNQPADIPVGGVFHPTDGFVRLLMRDGIPSVTAHGRFAHAQETRHGRRVVHDVPDPGRGAQASSAWHLSAVRRPWIGEFASAEQSLTRPAVVPPGTGFQATGLPGGRLPGARLPAARLPAAGSNEAVPVPALVLTRRSLPVHTVPPRSGEASPNDPRRGATLSKPSVASSPDPASAPALADHLASSGPAPHTRRRKRPETKHDVTTEA